MILAIICFLVAVAVGAWRQSCIVYESNHAAELGPRAWYFTGVKQTTWLITTIFSIFFAFQIATWVGDNFDEFIGKFSFGVSLMIRWFISMVLGAWPATKIVEEVMNSNNNDDAFSKDI